jgi:hypothetical protein
VTRGRSRFRGMEFGALWLPNRIQTSHDKRAKTATKGVARSRLERTAAVVDHVSGLLWYRMLFAHEPLDNKQLCTNQEG